VKFYTFARTAELRTSFLPRS